MTHPTDAAIAQANELMACPFCGYDALMRGDERGGFFVQCARPSSDCFAAMGENYDLDAMPEHMYRHEESAAAAWNRRTPPAQAAEAVERVARAIYANEWAPGSPAWAGLHDVNRIAWRNMARAAIAAMQAGEGKGG